MILPWDFELTPKEHILKNIFSTYDSNVLKSLQNALLTSYFTPASIIDSIVNPIQSYYKTQDFDPLIIEPSAGTGNFVKSLVDAFPKSSIEAIEKDIFTSKLLTHNFHVQSNVGVSNLGFENFNINNHYDLIVSNIPFGNYGIFDKQLPVDTFPLYKNQIQNFFFTKSTLLLNKGGILAFITTSSISDKNHSLEHV